MKTKRSALFAFLLINLISFTHAQAPAIEWQHCYGGTNGEEGYSIKATPDGGYIVAGRTDSYDGDVRGGYGGYDCWILKIDNTGTIQWQNVLGGMNSEEPKEISLTSDGGYIVAGYSQSNGGDVTGHHGTTNNSDVWIVKIDNNGDLQWQNSYGGTLDDYGKSIEQTTDGGYIVTGFTNSDDGDVAGYHNTNFGTFDAWVLKLSASGNIQWQKCPGGSMDDLGYAIKQTPDGGYIFTGAAASVDGDINPLQHHGFNEDYWVVKLDPAGSIQWQNCYGGSFDDWAQDLQLTPDGGYIIAGRSASFDGDVTPNPLSNNAAFDYWIVKINSSGAIQWNKSMGGTNIEDCWSIKNTSDGGYIVAGESFSYDGDVGQYLPAQSANAWLVKLSATGQMMWQRSAGSTDFDGANCIVPTDDGGYIITGFASKNDGDVSGFHGGYGDLWVVKFLGVPCVPDIKISVSGNNICSGTPLNFTSIANYAGLTPIYQWTVNGNPVGNGNDTFTTSALNNNDTVRCIMTSSAACASPRTAESDSVIIKIINKVQPAVVIKADNDSICPGTNVNFTATATNAGSLPSYQWKINGINTGANSAAYTNAALNNGDVVSCTLNSDPSFTCVTNPVAVSNSITMRVSDLVNATAEITVSGNNICKGADVTFSVASQNAGISPTYEWQVNGAATGSNTLTYSTSQLNNGDKIYCLVTPGTTGCSSLPVFSDTITMIVNDPPAITIKPGDTTIPAGSSLQLQADVTGNISSYEWTPSGSLVNPFSLSPFTNPILNDISFSLVAVSTAGCTSQEKVTIKVSTALYMPSAFTPNNDGLNDVFRIPPGVSLTLANFSIYDKWGNIVFKTTDKFKGWDGMINNKQANPGVYVYILKGSGNKGPVSIKGEVVLIR